MASFGSVVFDAGTVSTRAESVVADVSEMHMECVDEELGERSPAGSSESEESCPDTRTRYF